MIKIGTKVKFLDEVEYLGIVIGHSFETKSLNEIECSNGKKMWGWDYELQIISEEQEQIEHTSLPWAYHSGSVYQVCPDMFPEGENDGIPIAKMDRTTGNGTSPVERDNNAKFITKACNNHHDLVTLLKAAVARIDLEKENNMLKAWASDVKRTIEREGL